MVEFGVIQFWSSVWWKCHRAAESLIFSLQEKLWKWTAEPWFSSPSRGLTFHWQWRGVLWKSRANYKQLWKLPKDYKYVKNNPKKWLILSCWNLCKNTNQPTRPLNSITTILEFVLGGRLHQQTPFTALQVNQLTWQSACLLTDWKECVNWLHQVWQFRHKKLQKHKLSHFSCQAKLAIETLHILLSPPVWGRGTSGLLALAVVPPSWRTWGPPASSSSLLFSWVKEIIVYI